MKPRTQKLSFYSLLVSLAAATQLTATSALALDVTISGLRNSAGNVVVCVWRPDDIGFPNCGTGQPWKKAEAPATNPKLSFPELPPGTYSVSMFHDEKGLGKPATNFVGMPTSGVGLANNPALGMTNRPTFDKGRVTIPETKSITINVQYLF